ncbi:MAG: Ig-like domain-containing protein [Bacilli bacterium]|nr:Ig-like domain-containing protein [Bacilli bacterium]
MLCSPHEKTFFLFLLCCLRLKFKLQKNRRKTMKVSNKLALLALTVVGSFGMVGCKSNAKMPVNFVAVTSSSYNAEVQFGDYDYKFQGKINQGSNKFTLQGTAVARHATSSGGQGGPGGFPGGGFPGGFPGGNQSGPGFEGFGAEEAQQGGEQGQGQQGGFPGGGQEQGGQQGGEQGGFPGQGGEQGGFPGGGEQGGFPGGGEQGGQQGGEQQQAVAPESLNLSLSLSEAFINQSVTATVTAAPENASTSVKWSSSDEKVATVNNGTISPLAEGTVTITATSTVDETKSASATLKVVKEDLEKYNWAVSGTYVYEKGYGYKITFNDEGNTVVHTDFDKTEGRHSFYYNVKIGDESEIIQFQAKDPTFKDSLAKDYKKWDERDSKYVFYAKATGNNNSVATAYMYLHNSDGSVVLNTPSGANRSLTFGMTWEEKDGVITVHDGDKDYVADKSVNAEHPGYRIVYSGNTYYCSLNPEFKWKKFVTADFEGANAHEFVGSYTTSGPDGGTKEVNFNLVEDGKAKLYLGSSTASFVGSWSKDAANKLTIELDGKTAEFTPNAEGKYEITIRVSISSFFGSSTETIVLTQVK